MADQIDALRLAETLAARLCHDLSGPIGSLNQALELAAPEVPAGNEAFALARQAAADLAKRLRWRRAAWAPESVALDLLALRTVAVVPKIDLDVDGMPPATVFAPAMARALLNIVLLANDSLPRGGRIVLVGSSRDVFIAIEGPGAAWPSTLSQYLAGGNVSLDDPRTLQAPLTVLLARGLGLRLTMLLGSGQRASPLRLSES